MLIVWLGGRGGAGAASDRAIAAGQGVALVPELAVIGPPAGVVLTPLRTRRRTRIAYRKGARRQPAVSACIAAIRASARTLYRAGLRPCLTDRV